MKVTVVVPVYNEESTIGPVLDALEQLDLDTEIIVVDDGSHDGTGDVLRARGGAVHVEHLPVNLGKGAAVRHGISLATGDVLVIQDADLELAPDRIHGLVEPIEAGRADAVYGSRFLGGADGVRLTRRLANRLLTALTNLVFGVRLTDMETAHKAIDMRWLRGLPLESSRFEIEVELTAKLARLGARIVEIENPYRPRSHAEGKKIVARDGWLALLAIVRWSRWRPADASAMTGDHHGRVTPPADAASDRDGPAGRDSNPRR